jgi:PAS domain S-box-containing protein
MRDVREDRDRNDWPGDGADSAVTAGRDTAVAAPRADILVVDDNPDNLLALSQMLAGLDENIVQARSGADALRYLLRQDAAIVLLDIRMPDMDGYELAALVRNRARSRHTPIIFMTAYDRGDEEISRGYALGAVDYVFKPVDPVILKTKVSVFVELYKKTEAIRRQAELERRLLVEAIRARAEKEEAERALRHSEEIQSLVTRSLPIALYTADLNGRSAGGRFLSDSMARSVGFEASAFADDEDLWSARIHPADQSRVLEQIAAIAETGLLSTEYRWRCADGTERIFLDQAVLLRDGHGEPTEIVGTCLDVTDRRQLEQQLAQSQKMEAIGQLTGGIAHDFNNMLSVIIWNLDALSRSAKGRTKDQERAQNALGAALNCAELTRQLLTFARHQVQQAKVIDLAELVPRMARLLGPVIGETVAIEVELADDLWPVFVDPAQLESAILNLAINARDAMPNGGTLTLHVAKARNDRVEPGPAAGDFIVLSVTDTGVGMPQEVIDRAFEPFFTTKAVGKGTGLGLSMIYGFATQSGGTVRIESAVGAGTTVRLYLPRADAAQQAVDAPAAEEASAADAVHVILVVEDNADVRGMTVARLEELGHRVLQADGAASALDVLGESDRIDVLFTDVVMPGGMNGLDLARRARQLQPEIKLILVSGYASSFSLSGGVTAELLQKPYRDEDLKRTLSRALAGDGGGGDAQAAARRSSAVVGG